MEDQALTAGSLASVFQLAAGVALAMSVFRAPYERRYHRLGAILDREEIILSGREDANAVLHGDEVVAARAEWLAKGQEMEPIIRKREAWIWISVAMSCTALVVCSIWPSIEINRLMALILLAVVVGPLPWGAAHIFLDVRNSLSVLTKRIERL